MFWPMIYAQDLTTILTTSVVFLRLSTFLNFSFYSPVINHLYNVYYTAQYKTNINYSLMPPISY
jgi:hypothetical protein